MEGLISAAWGCHQATRQAILRTGSCPNDSVPLSPTQVSMSASPAVLNLIVPCDGSPACGTHTGLCSQTLRACAKTRACAMPRLCSSQQSSWPVTQMDWVKLSILQASMEKGNAPRSRQPTHEAAQRIGRIATQLWRRSRPREAAQRTGEITEAAQASQQGAWRSH